MDNAVNILVIEESQNNFLSLDDEFKKAKFNITPTLATDLETLTKLLEQKDWDIIISNYSLSNINTLETLKLLKQKNIKIPFIIVGNSIKEADLIEVMRAGASDYIQRSNIKQLIPTVEREFNEGRIKYSNKSAELRLIEAAAIVESSYDAIISETFDGIITSWNKAAERTYGYTAEEIVNKKHISILVPPNRPFEVTPIVEKIKKGERTEYYETTHVCKDQKVINVLLTISPFKNQKDEIAGISIISKDITEKKKAEAALIEKTKELERSNKELEQFAHVASHDLQEPLRKIIAFGDRLKSQAENTLDDDSKDFLNRMQKAAYRMRELIENLLQYSTLTAKEQEHTEIDLEDLINEVISDLEVRIQETSAKIEVGKLPRLYADKIQMQALFQNLITNSLKFRKKDIPPHVIIKSENKNNGLAEISLQDNGIGFDEKYLDRIFKPFQRLHTHTEYEGSGIGLTVCAKIVQVHGGKITAKSEPNKGSTFIITLPM